MAHTLTIPNANTNNPDLKPASEQHSISEQAQQRTWKSTLAKFWNYTEEVGNADTKSFKGIL